MVLKQVRHAHIEDTLSRAVNFGVRVHSLYVIYANTGKSYVSLGCTFFGSEKRGAYKTLCMLSATAGDLLGPYTLQQREYMPLVLLNSSRWLGY